MIVFDKLSFVYKGGERPALSEISLTIPKGEFLGIIGTAGAGKSTLTYAINGVVPHHFEGDFYGSVTVGGVDTVDASPEALAARVGSVFQDIDSQMTSAIVEDEILFGLENFGVPRDEIERRMDEALNALGIAELRDRDISTLSGGQKQKVAIAATLALKPEILVLDEPTGELDPQSSYEIFTLLKELNRTQGITVVIVEQKVMLQCEFSDRLLVMDAGKVIMCDTVPRILEENRALEALGVNCPRVVTLARELMDRGLYRGVYPTQVSGAARMVEGLL
jgi:energy-coupling factor transport system ATP-binding protein